MSVDDAIIGKSENGRAIHHSISGYHVHVGESEVSCDRQGNTHNPIDEPIIPSIDSLLGANIGIQQQQFLFMQEQERRKRLQGVIYDYGVHKRNPDKEKVKRTQKPEEKTREDSNLSNLEKEKNSYNEPKEVLEKKVLEEANEPILIERIMTYEKVLDDAVKKYNRINDESRQTKLSPEKIHELYHKNEFSKTKRECPIHISIYGYAIKGFMIGAILFGAYALYDCVNRNFLASKDYTWGTYSWQGYIKDGITYTPTEGRDLAASNKKIK